MPDGWAVAIHMINVGLLLSVVYVLVRIVMDLVKDIRHQPPSDR